MPTNHVVERLKEVVANYETVLRKTRKSDLTNDTRQLLLRIRKDTLNEMITLIKRLD
jgi:hypothetical protein